MTDEPTYAEQVLGFRIVDTAQNKSFNPCGYQKQWRVKRFDKKQQTDVWQVDKVSPASKHEFDMFTMLTKPWSEWGKKE